jgi:type II secretory pathway component PulJ
MKRQNFPQRDGKRRGRRGMVLFEVIIALTIFTLVAFSLVVALNSTFDAAQARNAVDVEIRGLQNQLELLNAARVAPIEKDVPDDGTGVLYHVSVEPAQMQDQKNQPVPSMYRATITATWKSGTEEEQRDVSELIFQP